MIDYHTHLGEPNHYSADYLAEGFKMRGKPVQRTTPDEHYEAMKGVDKCIVLAFRSRHLGFEVPNEYVAEYCRRDPEKLIGFACVDPHDFNALDELKECVTNLGLRGLKTSPIYQAYDPLDPRMMRIYRYCEDNGLPILTHHGTTFPRRAPMKWAHPEQVEEIALAFPELRIIIAHMGHPWENETISVIRKHPHVYADVSALYYRPWQLYNSLTLAKEYGVWRKLIFGTDFPICTFEDSIAGLRKAAEYASQMPFPSFTPADMEALLHNDILKELNLA
ncbi:amidohydrolase family protein [Paenibacillus koleovorans]|uniref:amidohydrolase family protein n=1 Tax=Paenibacillus koleovorans TaxID=121608 RepID=UPI000FD862D6|nr:amidohydrolase family protein [Paenibacillus koleovorans]